MIFFYFSEVYRIRLKRIISGSLLTLKKGSRSSKLVAVTSVLVNRYHLFCINLIRDILNFKIYYITEVCGVSGPQGLT